MGQKLLETRIGPQMIWAKSYVAPMTRQLPPWRTHDTYVAMQIRDGKISYVAAIRDGKNCHRLPGSARPRVR